LRLEPTQMAPDVFTAGTSAAARPPSMGSSPFGHATRFETTINRIYDPSMQRAN
jgi:hypothetical protein